MALQATPQGTTTREIVQVLELPPPRALLVVNDRTTFVLRLLSNGSRSLFPPSSYYPNARNAHTSGGSSSSAAPIATRTVPVNVDTIRA